MKHLTLDDIARMAGVSPSTVSRVINNQVGTRSKVRQRVLKVIEETGFQPHAAARSLAFRRSNVIGLLVPAPVSLVLAHPYLLQLAEFITQACHNYDHVLSLFLTGSGPEEQSLLPKITRKGFVDGFIVRVFDGRKSDPLLNKLSKTGLPFVISGRPTNPQNVSYVAADNATAAYKAITHLISLGRRRIAVIPGSLESYGNQERISGYRRAHDDQGLGVDERLIIAGSLEDAYLATQRLLPSQPDAIFCATGLVMDILRALREGGRHVPDDIALIGFDELPLAQQTEPPLTTMRQPIAAMGKQLVKTLLETMENEALPPRHIIFDAELVIRQSCGGLKV